MAGKRQDIAPLTASRDNGMGNKPESFLMRHEVIPEA
jgi:hypothetical protein